MSAPTVALSLAVSAGDFHKRIENEARELSRRRKAQAILLIGHDKFLDCLPSTPDEIDADWRHAGVVWATRLMFCPFREADVRPDRLESACYRHFVGIWLDEVKECLAYHRWIGYSDDWANSDLCRHYYFTACKELRNRLVNGNLKLPAIGSPAPLQYLLDTYFVGKGVLDRAKRSSLISQKSGRIDPGRATVFVDRFYGNIVAAIRTRDATATGEVLTAIEHAGSSPGQPGIVNAFEALLLVLFLDADIVRAWWHARGDDEGVTTL